MRKIGPSEENRFVELAVGAAHTRCAIRELVLEAAEVLDIAPRAAGRLAASLVDLLQRAAHRRLIGRLSLHAASGRGDRWLLAHLALHEAGERGGALAAPPVPPQGLDLFECRETRPAVQATLGVRQRRAAPVDRALMEALRARFTARLGRGTGPRVVAGRQRRDHVDRNRLEARLEELLHRRRGGGPPFTLALFAVDPLTADGRAAEAGLRRRAERTVLEALPDWLEDGDELAGYRGRVHALILPGTELGTAMGRLRRLSALVRAIPLGQGHRAGACFGVVQGFVDDSAQGLLQRASRALVRARQRGAGRVEAGLEDLQRLDTGDPRQWQGAAS